jgi:hypothetical protein
MKSEERENRGFCESPESLISAKELSSRPDPDFLPRGTKDDLVCGFHQGKPHELSETIALNRKSGGVEQFS